MRRRTTQVEEDGEEEEDRALDGNGAQSEFQAIAFHRMLGIRELSMFYVDAQATAKLDRILNRLPELADLKLVRCTSTAPLPRRQGNGPRKANFLPRRSRRKLTPLTASWALCSRSSSSRTWGEEASPVMARTLSSLQRCGQP